MNEKQLQEFLAYFPKWKVPFQYFKDRYAPMLLNYVVGAGRPIAEIKRSDFQGLLKKPILRETVKNLPDGILRPEALDAIWVPVPEVYHLTFGIWGNHSRRGWQWRQTSRPGKNLALQINFSERHNRAFKKMFTEKGYGDPFTAYGHPVRTDRHNTMAWVRIDFDLDGESALIEEIQTDWLRMVRWHARRMEWLIQRQSRQGQDVSQVLQERQELQRYMGHVLKAHLKQWDEAALMAAIWFLREEIGFKRIYYHTVKSGQRLKGFDPRREAVPPVSLYSKLPRRFCFQETERIPEFLRKDRSRRLRKTLKSGEFTLFKWEIDQRLRPELSSGLVI
jgi:hypothetical protein